MTDRSIAARVVAKSSRSPFVSRHVAVSARSSIPPSTCFAVAMLWSSAGMSSELLAGLGSCPTWGARAGDGEAMSWATPPGTIATCSASSPSVLAFSCGRHPSRLSGTRSRTRRVVTASSSSSRSMPSISAIQLPSVLSANRLQLLHPAPNPVDQERPALRERLTIAVGKQAQCRVTERDRGPAVGLLEPVLQIRRHGERHHQRSSDLEQRGSPDRLHVTPQVPVAVTEVAEPAAAGPRLERHRHRCAVVSFVRGAHLLEQRRKGRGEGRANVGLLRNAERQVLDSWGDRGHG